MFRHQRPGTRGLCPTLLHLARPALALEGTYRELSAGGGAGFQALTLNCWLFALSWLAGALDPVWAAAPAR